MSVKSLNLSLIASLSLASAASAEMRVLDAYARASNKMAGAAFMEITNLSDQDDRLIGVRSEVAKRVELHTHSEDANGVMKMLHVEEGFAISAGETHMLQRGGDHVMLMGLTHELQDGEAIPVTLVFEKAGELTLEIPVDQERKPGEGAHAGHGDHAAHSN